MEQSTMSISCVCACAHVISVSLCVMDDDVACLASVITPCISRCARIWFTDASASCSFASMIWVAIATDPYFATSSLFVIHRRDPNWRCLFFCLICRKNSECLQAPSHEAHCSMRIWSFALTVSVCTSTSTLNFHRCVWASSPTTPNLAKICHDAQRRHSKIAWIGTIVCKVKCLSDYNR